MPRTPRPLPGRPTRGRRRWREPALRESSSSPLTRSARQFSCALASPANLKWRAEHSNKGVQRASRTIGKGTGTPDEINEAREILSNYRLTHAFPLNAVTMTVRQRALDVNPNAVVAERRKRLPTILDKLKRHPTMSVTTMQDLGGCRM